VRPCNAVTMLRAFSGNPLILKVLVILANDNAKLGNGQRDIGAQVLVGPTAGRVAID